MHAWDIGTTDNEDWVVHQKITDGIYTWDVETVRDSFVGWSDFYLAFPSPNYDVYVDTRIGEGAPGAVCSGLIFRMSPQGIDEGAFVFEVCNDSTYYLSHYDKTDDWEDIVDSRYQASIRAGDWNRLEISSRGAHSILSINGLQAYEMLDERQIKGRLALLIDVGEAPANIQFDNFGYQSR